mgnify:CR=1 FL=1
MARRDDELIILGRLWRTLNGMGEDERCRAVDYLVSRHETKMQEARDAADEPVEFPVKA